MVIFIVGPTGVGKSRVGLALAQKLSGEILSADSMQIYRGMDIGTSKPSSEERSLIPHHLIDELDPGESWDAFRFAKAARRLIDEIEARGRTPLVVGGSGLYVRALADGIFDGPGADWEIRRALYEEAGAGGTAALHERLGRVDPDAAAKIQSNDLRRVVRALEIYESSGKPATEWKRETPWERASAGLAAERPVAFIGLTCDRKRLYARIDARVEEMMARGFLEEVRRLASKIQGHNTYFPQAFHEGNKYCVPVFPTASQALGYKELLAHLAGETTLEEARRLIQRNTRRYAKRQWAWFKRDQRIRWFEVDPEDPEGSVDVIQGHLKVQKDEIASSRLRRSSQ